MPKTAAQLDAEIKEYLRLRSPEDPRDRKALLARLDANWLELRAMENPGYRKGSAGARENAALKRQIIEDTNEILRQLSGKAASLPRWSERMKRWHGGDRRTLYLFTFEHPRREAVYPGDSLPSGGRDALVRIATRAEAEAMWQKPLHAGWRVAD